MKRPDMMALYAPVKYPAKEVATRILDFFVSELKGHLMRYYARLEFAPQDGSYDFAEEALDLKDRDDLLRRVNRDVDCEWAFYLYLVFYPAEVYCAVFRDRTSSGGSTLMLTIDPKITKSFEDEEEGRMPFAIFLIAVAQAIESNWFVSGPYIDEIKPLHLEQLRNPENVSGLYIIGWKAGKPEEEVILSALKEETKSEAVKRTTLGYNVVLRYA
jgi:hypothetical protein